jgi:hypothetical protein
VTRYRPQWQSSATSTHARKTDVNSINILGNLEQSWTKIKSAACRHLEGPLLATRLSQRLVEESGSLSTIIHRFVSLVVDAVPSKPFFNSIPQLRIACIEGRIVLAWPLCFRHFMCKFWITRYKVVSVITCELVEHLRMKYTGAVLAGGSAQ